MHTTLPKAHELRLHPVVVALAASSARYNTQKPAKLWLACSGGRDSMSLAYAAWLLQLPICLIHVNHNLQSAAHEWQQLVGDFASRLGIDCIAESVQLNGTSEACARVARYAAFAQHLAHEDVIMLAHHQDDQAETILLNLLRGSGLAGLSGMQPWCSKTIDQKTLQLWRPWLGVSREHISHFAHTAKLPFVDDPTNVNHSNGDTENQNTAHNTNARAFLRSHILPKLTQRFGAVVPSIARSSDIIEEAKQALDEQLKDDLAAVSIAPDKLDLVAFAQLPKPQQARQMRVLCAFMQAKGAYAPPRERINQALAMSLAQTTDQSAQVVFSECQLRRYKRTLYRLPKHIKPAKTKQVTLHMGDALKLPSGSWQVAMSDEAVKNSSLPLYLLGDTLSLRPKQDGERIQLAGRVGSRPLKKIFQDLALAPWQRQQAHILCYQGASIAVICAAGFFVAEGWQTAHGWCFIPI